jgi:hypothetical protein
MRALGRELRELARWPLPVFRAFVTGEVVRTRLAWLDKLDRQLDRCQGRPAFWAREVKWLIERSADALVRGGLALRPALGRRTPDEFDRCHPDAADRDHRQLQRLIGRYGRLLCAWPGLFDAAVALRERAPELFALG